MTPAQPKNSPEMPPVEEMSYEQALAELESIVASLEVNKQSLEESMAFFERGQALSRRCVELLDKAELRIKQLAGDTIIDLPAEE